MIRIIQEGLRVCQMREGGEGKKEGWGEGTGKGEEEKTSSVQKKKKCNVPNEWGSSGLGSLIDGALG